MDAIIIGAGVAGATAARILAEKGRHVLILEKRAHAGGNCYDESDEHGILVHRYGPHIFHTDNEDVFEFLSRFTGWLNYRHRVAARIGDVYVPVPFNVTSIEACFPPEKAKVFVEKLIARYGEGARPSILTLLKEQDADLSELGKYVYEHIFKYYTAKQWGGNADNLDEAVLARVPLRVSREDGYFADKYQCMPDKGYTAMIAHMLDHENITLETGTDALSRLNVTDAGITFDGQPCSVPVIYTGALDEMYHCDMGALPYRSLRFELEYMTKQRFQPATVVNYTVSEAFTRITEYKYLTGCDSADGTTVCREYPAAFTDPATQIPYYPIPDDASRAFYGRYAQRAAKHPNLMLLGRLAEYRYYDIDDIVARAMAVTEGI